MADDLTISKSDLVSQVQAAAQQGQTVQEKNNQIGKDEFLTLLVTQLKHQDPLDPMQNEDFAVNLAQFSQLEQLIDINGKLTDQESGAGQLGSMAAYLGNEVLLDSSTVEVAGRNGGSISFNLDSGTANTAIELLDGDGSVAGVLELGALAKGSHSVALDDLNVPNGEYEVRVSSLSPTGATFETQGYVSGLVSGFVPGPEPVLLLNGREISPGEVREVRLPSPSSE